jgi:predicted XRE-type DNA-binding protein
MSLSATLRKLLREKIIGRIDQLQLKQADAAKLLNLEVAQMSKLVGNEDIFSLDRLIDAAERMGLSIRMTVTRPYRHS